MDSDSKNIPWNEIIKKNAVGINHEDFGEITGGWFCFHSNKKRISKY